MPTTRLFNLSLAFLALTMSPCLAQTAPPADQNAAESTTTIETAPIATDAAAPAKQQDPDPATPQDNTNTDPQPANAETENNSDTEKQPAEAATAPADAGGADSPSETAAPLSQPAPDDGESGLANTNKSEQEKQADTATDNGSDTPATAGDEAPGQAAAPSPPQPGQPNTEATEDSAGQATDKEAGNEPDRESTTATPQQPAPEQPVDASPPTENTDITPAAPEAEPASTGNAEPEPASQDTAEPTPAAPEKLSVATGSGAFAEAYQRVVLAPFANDTGIEIDPAPSDQDLSNDVVMLDAAALAERCGKKELTSLDIADLQPDEAMPGAAEGFLDGALQPCGIAAMSWSNLFVYDPAQFKRRAPSTIADVFNTRRYPGKRALPANGRGLFEALMVADGVEPANVYPALETGDGLMRALQRLQALGKDVVWYDNLPDAIGLIRSGDAAMALTSNGHAFIEQARSGPLGLIWQGQSLHLSFYAIPKNVSDPDRAKQFVAFASRPQQLAALARQIPYGPTRRSAIAGTLGMRHAVTGQELEPFLSTAPENLRDAVRFDPIWWQENSARMAAALDIARHGPPPPTRR